MEYSTCDFCDNFIHHANRFCASCGQEALKRCHLCRTVAQRHDLFCTGCGERLKSHLKQLSDQLVAEEAALRETQCQIDRIQSALVFLNARSDLVRDAVLSFVRNRAQQSSTQKRQETILSLYKELLHEQHRYDHIRCTLMQLHMKMAEY